MLFKLSFYESQTIYFFFLYILLIYTSQECENGNEKTNQSINIRISTCEIQKDDFFEFFVTVDGLPVMCYLNENQNKLYKGAQASDNRLINKDGNNVECLLDSKNSFVRFHRDYYNVPVWRIITIMMKEYKVYKNVEGKDVYFFCENNEKGMIEDLTPDNIDNNTYLYYVSSDFKPTFPKKSINGPKMKEERLENNTFLKDSSDSYLKYFTNDKNIPIFSYYFIENKIYHIFLNEKDELVYFLKLPNGEPTEIFKSKKTALVDDNINGGNVQILILENTSGNHTSSHESKQSSNENPSMTRGEVKFKEGDSYIEWENINMMKGVLQQGNSEYKPSLTNLEIPQQRNEQREGHILSEVKKGTIHYENNNYLNDFKKSLHYNDDVKIHHYTKEEIRMLENEDAKLILNDINGILSGYTDLVLKTVLCINGLDGDIHTCKTDGKEKDAEDIENFITKFVQMKGDFKKFLDQKIENNEKSPVINPDTDKKSVKYGLWAFMEEIRDKNDEWEIKNDESIIEMFVDIIVKDKIINPKKRVYKEYCGNEKGDFNKFRFFKYDDKEVLTDINNNGLNDSYFNGIIAIGKDVKIERLKFKGMVIIDDKSTIGRNVLINGGTYIGPGCTIHQNSMIGEMCFLEKDIKFFSNVRIQDNNYFYEGVKLGKYMTSDESTGGMVKENKNKKPKSVIIGSGNIFGEKCIVYSGCGVYYHNYIGNSVILHHGVNVYIDNLIMGSNEIKEKTRIGIGNIISERACFLDSSTLCFYNYIKIVNQQHIRYFICDYKEIKCHINAIKIPQNNETETPKSIIKDMKDLQDRFKNIKFGFTFNVYILLDDKVHLRRIIQENEYMG